MAEAKTTTRDPKPSVDRIQNLAQRIMDGDILLPVFQRDFVWNRSQVIELLDSISRNYPIGSILLWLSRQSLRSETNIADLDFAERPDEYPVNYLLDGQQRLSTICGVLYWTGEKGLAESIWNVAYDLRNKSFVHLYTMDDPPLHQIRLNKLPDAAAYFKHIAALDTLASEDKADLNAEAERLFNIFKDYSIASVTLQDMPINDVAPIFERINSTGTKLTTVDLMRAATWSEAFDLVDTIDERILESLSARGFVDIERKAVLRVISAAAGGTFSVDSIDDLRNKSADELNTASDSVDRAMQLAVDFLRDQIGVPNAKILPYGNQIVVLAEVFRRLPTLNAEQLTALRAWFWRTTLSSYFSGWNTGQMSSDMRSVERFASGENASLEASVTAPSAGIWETRQFRANNAHTKMLGLMLSQNGPRDLVNGQNVRLETALAWQNVREYHHVFPKAFLEGQNLNRERINCLANCALISSSSNKWIAGRPPSEYLAECQKSLGDEFRHVIASNLISEKGLEAAMEDDFDAFIKERQQTLHQHALHLASWSVE